ncbi:MAG: paraquat-inducible protein A [Desulfobacterales bacterium]|nr:paraquat-inducible protein A [Desulfobacterales bacterium]
MRTNSMIACHQCDLLHRVRPLKHGGVAQCMRCGAVLYRRKKDSLNRTLSLAIAGIILFVVANTYPFLAIKSEGLMQETTLLAGVKELYVQNMWELAALVLITTFLTPFIQLSGMIYVLLPLKFNRLPWRLPFIFRFLQNIQPWGMMEVFMLGILVAIVKLAKMANIIPGIALYSFAALILVLAGAMASLDPDIVWDRLGEN